MTQLNRMPTYDEKLTTNGQTTRGWYSFWSGLLLGQASGLPSSISVSPSPFNYQAVNGGSVIVQGGTVSMIQIARSGTNYNVGATAGVFPLSQGDSLIVNYSATPTMTFIPR